MCLRIRSIPVLLPIFVIFFLLPAVLQAQELILKIPVTREGIFRITYNDLGYYGQSYGIDPAAIDPSRIHLYNRDREAAITVVGEDDGTFGTGDSIEFYGVPVRPEDPEYKYTEENVYWLKITSVPPVRMASWESPAGGVLQSSFLHTAHAESNWIYWETMPDGVGLDHWFWGQKISAGESRNYTFSLSNVVGTGSPATVRVSLHGRTNVTADPDHHTRIRLNGTLLGEFAWDGQEPLTYSFDKVSSALLINGENTLTVEEVSDPAVTVDSIFVNWIEVDYSKSFLAEGDRLTFTARGNGILRFSISGFTHPGVQVFNVSDPLHPEQLSNPVVTLTGSSYKVEFSDPISGESTYLVQEIRTASFSFPSDPSALKSTALGADYILITHEDFKDAVLPLAQHREGQGYRVKVVTTQEIYDAFSGGIFTPQAIKDFLKYAYGSWKKPAPEFVLLVGDANLDYKDYWMTGQVNRVPTHLVETTVVGETPSDHWFVTVSGDDPLPDMLIGRIPAKTVNEVTVMVNKIIAYETGAKEDWRYRVLMATNDLDPRFKEYADEWIGDHLPTNYTPERVDVSQYADKNQSRTDFLKDLNDGALITGFFGHGSVDLWAGSQDFLLFESKDAASLTNQGRLPFVVAFNCLNGLFAMPSEGTPFPLPDGTGKLFSVPLPEALLFQKDKGAIAMWSPAAFAYPSEQLWIGHELFSGLFEAGNNILGSVTTQAKVNAYVEKGVYVENLDVFTFFGDPATRIPLDIPKRNTLSGSSSGSGGGGCFIATAAYGSYLHPYVKILRDFRDQALLKTGWGTQMVEIYYDTSPPLAGWIQDRGWARRIVQVALLPVIFGAWLVIGAPGWVQGSILGFAVFGGIGLISRKWLRKKGASCFLILWVSGMFAASPSWAISGEEDLHLVRSDERGLSVEWILPSFKLEKSTLGQAIFDRVSISDYGFLREIGKPEVPMRGTLIAIPEEGDVSLKVIPGDYETRRLRIGPVLSPREEVSLPPFLDPAVYETSAFYPGPLATEGFTGYMRDQKVMQILFFPVQYNPVTGEVRIYKKIELTIDFGRSVRALKKTVPSGGKGGSSISHAYENLLKGSLLNYSAVRGVTHPE
ncbi:MAG: hypothetical protein HZA19_03460 [Nitrospirae bacterium]|nr:hypothetical protein [Nitrospirota bacterium]